MGKNIFIKRYKIVSSGARMDGLLNISFDEYSTVTVLLPDIKEQERCTVEALLMRSISPIRPGRTDSRKLTQKPAVSFTYRVA